MKIVFTGGGSGGHFYPLIAVAQELQAITKERNLLEPELFYLANSPYDKGVLFENAITFKHVSAGKLRNYFALKNGTDVFKTLVGLPTALHQLFSIWPDVVFSKGGYPSVPVVVAARILRIPVFVHDSDAVPGRANILAGKIAERIAVSYPEAVEHFTHKEKVALIGNPIRQETRIRDTTNGHQHFALRPDMPTLLVLGGSQGAEHINMTILRAAPELLTRYQIIHQVGASQYDSYKEMVHMELGNNPLSERYKIFPTLNTEEYRLAAGAANLVIARAGSGTIFEIAAWELPSILVPIPESVSRDQHKNAYAYARTGAAEVVEQRNCTEHTLTHEIDRILSSPETLTKMQQGAHTFQKLDAARTIAEEIMRIALAHEK